jgi:hypothetical protein
VQQRLDGFPLLLRTERNVLDCWIAVEADRCRMYLHASLSRSCCARKPAVEKHHPEVAEIRSRAQFRRRLLQMVLYPNLNITKAMKVTVLSGFQVLSMELVVPCSADGASPYCSKDSTICLLCPHARR